MAGQRSLAAALLLLLLVAVDQVAGQFVVENRCIARSINQRGKMEAHIYSFLIHQMQAKLQDVKITQPSSSSSSSTAAADDIYSQIGLAEYVEWAQARHQQVCGVASSQCQAQLRAENVHLNAMVKELTERLSKVESIIVESKQVESTPNMEICVQSSASVIEPKGKECVDRRTSGADSQVPNVGSATAES
ncbi:hypothetical protein Taro_011601 [Colocasia esculenta]|uniref:Uncharacterized protein n=1 Tax=Colocasia esculenta TaxID=4460 RepID=A0A843UGL0_COLES|nr:hypothetical protein [Colocasia esculenta]